MRRAERNDVPADRASLLIRQFNGSALRPEEAGRLRQLFSEVAIGEMGWPAQDLIEDRVGDAQVETVNFVAFHGDEIAGATKIVISRPFQIEHAFPEVATIINADSETEKVAEAALTAVRRLWRGRAAVMLGIFASVYQWATRESVLALYSIHEKPTDRLYRRVGLPFEELAPGKFYWGGTSSPYRLTFEAVSTKFRQRVMSQDGLGPSGTGVLQPRMPLIAGEEKLR